MSSAAQSGGTAMTTTTSRPAALRGMTDDDLAGMFAAAEIAGDAGTQARILAELARQDQARAYWAAVSARNNLVRNEWREAAYAQYLAAEAACNGVLVQRHSPVADPWDLWSGSERFAMCHASEELRNFWLDNPRVTVTAYVAQHAAAAGIHRDDMDRAAMDAAGQHETETEGDSTDDGLAGNEPAAVRRDASAGREDAAVRGDRAGDVVPGPHAGGARGADAGARPAGNAGPVRGPVVTRDSADGARVDVTRDGRPAGYAYRVQVKARGHLQWAWWGVRADGSMSLRPDRRAAVRAVLA